MQRMMWGYEEASESWKTSSMASLSEAASASQAGYTCRHLPPAD